jgi:hypothetical protein
MRNVARVAPSCLRAKQPQQPRRDPELRRRLAVYSAHVARAQAAHDERAEYAWAPPPPSGLRRRPRAFDHYMAATSQVVSEIPPIDDGTKAAARPHLTVPEMCALGVPAACADLIDRAQRRDR